MQTNENQEQVMSRRLAGRRALVTGANMGIGRGVALRLAREGASVVVNYLKDPEAAEEVVREIKEFGVGGIAIQADVANEDQVEQMFEQAAAGLGGLDILVNNAGMEPHHPFLEVPLEDWRRVIDVDLTGPFLCAQRAARLMVKAGQGGSIVQISSVHQIIPWGGYAHYC